MAETRKTFQIRQPQDVRYSGHGSGGFTMVSAVEIEEEGDCDYIVTVPDNAKYMMISANENGEGIWVRRINVLTE